MAKAQVEDQDEPFLYAHQQYLPELSWAVRAFRVGRSVAWSDEHAHVESVMPRLLLSTVYVYMSPLIVVSLPE
jgi:hypothetical protein